MKSQYKKMFEPISINGMVLRNRVFGASGVSADSVNELGGIEAPEAISLGGASMVITCMCDLDDPKSRFTTTSDYSLCKKNRDTIRTYVKRVHQGGAKYIIELDHVGEYHRSGEDGFSWGTIDKVNEKGINVKAMTVSAMEDVAQSYCRGALDAMSLGFDGILFDCASGWLMSQFISTHYNKRDDEFGGSIENRCQFPLMVLKELRKTVGKNYPILCQICADEYFEDGTPFEDIVKMSQIFEPYIDCLLVICGNDQTRLQMTKLVSTNLEPFMITADYTKQLKQVLSIPVAAIGGIMRPEDAENLLENNNGDLIGLCRPLLADHNWVKKAAQNQSEDIRPCLRCNQCFHVSTDCRNIGCSVNPYYTQIGYQYLTKESLVKEKKHLVIVGAGPAGIQAALAADSCGHQVTLIEKDSEVGGLLNFIAKEHYKTEVARYLQYLKTQLQKSNVQVLTHTEATREMITSLSPDKLIIAIGGKENELKIDGMSSNKVYSMKEAIDQQDQLGNNVVIIGGGTVGLELALGMSKNKNVKISIIERSDQLATSANLIYRPALLDRIDHADNIDIYINTTCLSIDEQSVIIQKDDLKQKIHTDSIIIAIGMSPKVDKIMNLYGIVENTVTIGDANTQGNIIDATYGGQASGVNV